MLEIPDTNNFFETDPELGTILKSVKSGLFDRTNFKRYDGIKGDIGYALGWFPNEHIKEYSDIQQIELLFTLRTSADFSIISDVEEEGLNKWFTDRMMEVALHGGNALVNSEADSDPARKSRAIISNLIARKKSLPQLHFTSERESTDRGEEANDLAIREHQIDLEIDRCKVAAFVETYSLQEYLALDDI